MFFCHLVMNFDCWCIYYSQEISNSAETPSLVHSSSRVAMLKWLKQAVVISWWELLECVSCVHHFGGCWCLAHKISLIDLFASQYLYLLMLVITGQWSKLSVATVQFGSWYDTVMIWNDQQFVCLCSVYSLESATAVLLGRSVLIFYCNIQFNIFSLFLPYIAYIYLYGVLNDCLFCISSARSVRMPNWPYLCDFDTLILKKSII
jgi:hypothetical protein